MKINHPKNQMLVMRINIALARLGRVTRTLRAAPNFKPNGYCDAKNASRTKSNPH